MSSRNRPPINAAAPASILRRVPANTRNSALNPTPPFYCMNGINRNYADVFGSAYGNLPQEIMLPQYIAPPQNIPQAYYTGQQPNAIQEDGNANNDDAEELYENEEELAQIDNVITEAAGETGEDVIDQGRPETNKDNQMEYVKSPRKHKATGKQRDNMIVPAEVSAQKTIDPVLYDSRIAHNTQWQNAAINQANLNTADIKQTDVARHPSRKDRYTYQGTEPNQITSYNKQYIQDRNTEAWIKYQEALKRGNQSRSPNKKAVPKQPLLKLCVGAEDSSGVEGIEQILGQMENNEMATIKRDLKDFQKARRRLIYDATNIKPMFSYPPK